MSELSKILRAFKEKTTKEKQKVIISMMVCGSVIYLILLYLMALFVKMIDFNHSEENLSIIHYMFEQDITLTFTTIVFVLISLLIILALSRRDVANRVKMVDERGVQIMEKGTHGSSRWMEDEEVPDVYEHSKPDDTDTTIYGKLHEGDKKVVGFKYGKHGTGNKNMILVGPSGAGKSWSYVMTEILQTIKRQHSFIATDPSGELYQVTADYARKNGYDIKILNLVDTNYSDYWNCVSETIDPETGRLDSQRLKEFCDIYMRNSGDPNAKSDMFWDSGATNLLSAAMALASWRREKEIIKGYEAIYKWVATNDPKKEEIQKKFINIDAMSSFTMIEEIIRNTAEEQGFDIEKVNEIIAEIKEEAPKFTIADVVDILMNFENAELEFSSMPTGHPGKASYRIFMTNAKEQVRGSIMQGLLLRMQLFTSPKISMLLDNEGINISDINKKKSAYYVMLPEGSSGTMKPIASLFFSFFFKDSQQNYNKEQQIAKQKGTKNPCIPVTVMLDEFFSVGVIGGDINEFATTASVCRKKGLALNIIVQSLAQINQLYGDENADTIITCCDTLLCFGGKNERDCKFISELIAGHTTVLSERHSEGQSLIGEMAQRLDDVKVTTAQRALLTPDEVYRCSDIILSKFRQLPLRLKPFSYTDLACVKNHEFDLANFYDDYEKMSVRFEREQREKIEKNVQSIASMIKELKSSKEVEKPKKKRTHKKKKDEDINLFDIENEEETKENVETPIEKETKKTKKVSKETKIPSATNGKKTKVSSTKNLEIKSGVFKKEDNLITNLIVGKKK